MSAAIVENDRIAGTRITVYDVLTYSEAGWGHGRIAAMLRISTAEVQAALDYVAANHDVVMENYRRSLGRIAKGNPPEIEARRQESHKRLLEMRAELERRKESNARHPVGPQH